MAVLKSRDPANDEVLGEVQVARKADVVGAIEAASTATPLSLKARIAVVRRFQKHLLAHRDALGRLIAQESGKPLAEAMLADILAAHDAARHLADLAPKALAARRLSLDNILLMDRNASMTAEPLGTVAVIAPWNFPLSIPTTGILTAWLAGNRVVFRPAPQTPLVGQWLAEALWTCGVPQDQLHIVHGGPEVGQALVAGDIDGLTFTGSVATGRVVATACAERLIPSVLELGGKDPMVVLPGGGPRVVQGAVWGAFTNAGQACASVERLYLPRADHDHLVADIVRQSAGLRIGHGLEPGTEIGPVIDDAAVARIKSHIQDAEKRGATVLTGGVRDDVGPRFIAPVVLTGVDHDMRCMREETFGPTLPIMAYDTVEDAIRLANDSDYGLTASVWGRDAPAWLDRFEAGTVFANECVYSYAVPSTPWTGWKDSGTGSSHGPDAFAHVTQTRHRHVAGHRRAASLWHHPYDGDLDAVAQHVLTGRKMPLPRTLRALRRRR